MQMRLLIGVVFLFLPAVNQAQEEVDFFAGRSPGLNSEQISQGWIALFDNASLYGWRREAAEWKVLDETIHVNSGDVGLLRTPVQFDDFELQLEFKATDETNSGVFIRTSPRPKSATDGCIEINIAPESVHLYPTGSIVGHCKAKGAALKPEFNLMHITAIANKVTVSINGRRVSELANDQFPRKGYIGLQHNSGAVQFRNIVVKPVQDQSIFDGRTLAGWKTDQRLESQFAIEGGELKMKGGRGQLESKERYADFIFSAHIRTNAQGLNSGVFFRCIPGDIMNGYESQIENQFVGKDRSKPRDHGTGGIFRRCPARWVNASDEKWFAKTIIADGATICIWVNGLLVADWTDQRKPNQNPRRGRRLEAGTIILQGHDPTTDLSFRKIRVRELNPRK